MEKDKYKLIGIVAMTNDRVIGKDGDLPWHLPEDLKFFKKTTLGHPIIMGRKTYDSIGKPLPKRKNIVLTRNQDWQADGVEVIHAPEDIYELQLDVDKAFIIGGAEVYQLYLPLLDELIITHIAENYMGDTFFPEYKEFFPNEKNIQKEIDFNIISHKR